MPKAKVAARGGAVRIRTVKIDARRYATVYVVRRPGKRGGRTVLGEVKRKRTRRVS